MNIVLRYAVSRIVANSAEHGSADSHISVGIYVSDWRRTLGGDATSTSHRKSVLRHSCSANWRAQQEESELGSRYGK